MSPTHSVWRRVLVFGLPLMWFPSVATPIYTITSMTAEWTGPVFGSVGFTATGTDSFSIDGGGAYFGVFNMAPFKPGPAFVGPDLLFLHETTFEGISGAASAAGVNFGGVCETNNDVVTTVPGFVLPATANPVVTVPGATMAGSIPGFAQIESCTLRQGPLLFTANVNVSGTMTLTFSGPDANGFDTIVDAKFVSSTVIPEPGSFALAVFAAAMAGFVVFRKRCRA